MDQVKVGLVSTLNLNSNFRKIPMKTLNLLFLALCAVLFSSCTGIPVPGGQLVFGQGGGYGGGRQQVYRQNSEYNQHQQRGGAVESYNLTKTRARLFQANISDVPHTVPAEKANHVREELASYADEVWDSKDRPQHQLTADEASDFASEKLGHTVRAEVRMKTLEGAERVVVHTERVKLSDVPAHIRAKFENKQ